MAKMNRARYNNLYNEGGEGYNPYKTTESLPPASIQAYMVAMGKRDKLQDKLAYGDLTAQERDDVTAQLHQAQAALDHTTL